MSQNEYEESPSARERVMLQLEQSRYERQLKKLIDDEFQKRREWFIVSYQGYDASCGLHKVKRQDGTVIYAQAQSIPGSVGVGSTLVAFCQSGSRARLFMPL